MGSLIACFPKNTLLLGQDHSHLGGKENRVECNLWRSSLGAQRVKNLPAVQETRVRYLGQEEGMATHSRILAWRIPWTEEPGGLQSLGSQTCLSQEYPRSEDWRRSLVWPEGPGGMAIVLQPLAVPVFHSYGKEGHWQVSFLPDLARGNVWFKWQQRKTDRNRDRETDGEKGEVNILLTVPFFFFCHLERASGYLGTFTLRMWL